MKWSTLLLAGVIIAVLIVFIIMRLIGWRFPTIDRSRENEDALENRFATDLVLATPRIQASPSFSVSENSQCQYYFDLSREFSADTRVNEAPLCMNNYYLPVTSVTRTCLKNEGCRSSLGVSMQQGDRENALEYGCSNTPDPCLLVDIRIVQPNNQGNDWIRYDVSSSGNLVVSSSQEEVYPWYILQESYVNGNYVQVPFTGNNGYDSNARYLFLHYLEGVFLSVTSNNVVTLSNEPYRWGGPLPIYQPDTTYAYRYDYFPTLTPQAYENVVTVNQNAPGTSSYRQFSGPLMLAQGQSGYPLLSNVVGYQQQVSIVSSAGNVAYRSDFSNALATTPSNSIPGLMNFFYLNP